MRLPVRIVGLYADPMSDATIVMLSEPGEVTRVLPIFIGPAEGQSIALALAGVEMPRPGTHDLMVAALESLGTRLDSVTITTLADGAFLAEVVLDEHERVHVLDARPSDGIALAIRTGGLLFVENSVMDEASVTVEHETNQPFDDAEIENIVAEFHDFLATTEPDDFTGENLTDDKPPDHDDNDATDNSAPEDGDPELTDPNPDAMRADMASKGERPMESPPNPPPRRSASPPSSDRPPGRMRQLSWLLIVAAMLLILLVPVPSTDEDIDVDYSDFVVDVENDEIATAIITEGGGVTGDRNDGSVYRTQIPEALVGEAFLARLESADVDIKAERASPSLVSTLLGVVFALGPFALLIAFWVYLGRKTPER